MPVRRRPGHHARGDARPRRRPAQDQPAGAGRAGHRPLGDRRRLRHAPTPSAATSSSSSSATASATSSCAGARRAFDDFKVVPPGTGIVHQVNIEHLARVVFDRRRGRARSPTPTRCVGTDSHTTMVNGLGVLGWGVGGIEAEAAMLGQPVSMLIPRVVGFKLTGELPEGATATDLVLTITEMLRKHGVVGKFVEFYGARRRRRAAGQPRHDRQHEPGVRLDLRDLPDRRGDPPLPAPHRPLRRSRSRWSRPTPRSRASGTTRRREPAYSETSSSTSRPSAVASPARSGRRTGSRCSDAKARFRGVALPTTPSDGRRTAGVDEAGAESFPASDPPAVDAGNGERRAAARGGRDSADGGRPSQADHGHPRRTAPRSRSTTAPSSSPRSPRCTNTSNPYGHDRRRAAGQERRRARPDHASRG